MEFVTPFRRTGEFNPVERLKLERHPLEVAEAVRARYAEEGPSAIASVPGEMERLKWVGLYPQRQGGDAFMLRIKVPAGRLRADQVRRVGEVVDRFARGPEEHPVWGNRYCDLTTRQDIQLHWVRIADVPVIWDLLEEVGVTTVQACGDSARNVLCCPVAGVDAEEVIDASPLAAAISDFFTGNREYANLPRKFKLSVTGCLDDCAQAEINDVGLLPARRDDGAIGFNLLVGGGLSDGPRMASDLDVFLLPDQVVEGARAIAQLFGELGNREHRGVSRMRYLVQELGPERFRDELARRAEFELTPAGTGLTRRYRGDHVGVHAQSGENLSYVGCSVTVGRLSGADLVEAARLAEEYGDGEVRLATDQNLVFTGVSNDRLEELLAETLLERHSPFPGPFSRGAVACTGSEFCRFAIVETKVRARQWAEELDRRLAEPFGGPAGTRSRPEELVLRMHFSGCPASCAQPQIADVGFRGDTAHVGDQLVEAVDIGLGGSLGAEAAFGDWVAGAVPVDEVPGALVSVVGRYLDERRDGERFHAWARRTPRTELLETLSVGADVGSGAQTTATETTQVSR
ncbi:MAG: Ferredoxin--nitrite reductase [Acidimicrobiaceae bacterium]|nr:Ferredoxin--nitrite reductase [Acidimicrobiaceae bacterium]